MRRTKTVDQMSMAEIKSFVKIISMGLLFSSTPLFLIAAWIIEDPVYQIAIGGFAIIMAISCMVTLLLLHWPKYILKAFHIGGSFILLFLGYAFYAWGCVYLQLQHTSTKLLLLASTVLIVLQVLIRRFSINNSEFVAALKKRKHGKYIIKDVGLAFVLCVLFSAAAKLSDSDLTSILNSRAIYSILFTELIFSFSSNAVVYNLVNYKYISKYREIEYNRRCSHK